MISLTDPKAIKAVARAAERCVQAGFGDSVSHEINWERMFDDHISVERLHTASFLKALQEELDR